jgi:8-amino-7-oxononanoate synthase
VPTLEVERARLQAEAGRVRGAFRALGLNTGTSDTQIVPAIVGDEAATLEFGRRLEEQGILAIAIRPPTVPARTSRIRLALSAAHCPTDIDALIAAAASIVEAS